ncbi:MAG: purine-nucleoside phosphorylase [Deltaproteobacteria bacterium]|nr:purine-nucleoside phosphorylase [Deltaproteobacteria bacterium]MBW2015335.1 purine-nucleoside phosphorylase [Deltaproteobacteria bacterium]MBW2128196.1 purine-nucleoside phosphorylase [Deltaproteobacteria bacterium]MBW2303087.1 purine-nucleoside phosphorylase [Deltaproteobacteria bacterium]
MQREIVAATEYLSSRLSVSPRIGMITGTGLGDLTGKISVENRIPYEEIPHFPVSTIPGHKGNLVAGTLLGKRILAMEGRFHLYEGYSPQQITFPIRVMSKLGVDTLLISSAAGGLNPRFRPGDIMVVTDHINLTGQNPLVGPNLEEFGPRFPDMSCVYPEEYLALAREKALELGILLWEGVYVAITGPSLETPAETRFLRMIGADAVGMSTVPEVIVAVHCGMKVMAIVAITNLNLPDCMESTSIEEVISNAKKAGGKLADLWATIIEELPEKNP